MTLFLSLAQMVNPEQQGWLTAKLLATLTASAEWVLWLLAFLSILSIAVMLERGVYFATHRLSNSDDLLLKLAKGDLDAVRTSISGKQGMEASVLREGLEWSSRGADSVDEVISATMARERPRYERFLSVLGTLGSNTPFIGLFGTVLGIIHAFAGMAASGSGGLGSVAGGIAEALYTTAGGLMVAIPAVWFFNKFTNDVEKFTVEMQNTASTLVDYFIKHTGKS